MPESVVKVLLVEGDAGDAARTRVDLAASRTPPFVVQWADRLDVALRQLQQGAPDVVLLSLVLPDSQGWDTLARWRARAYGVPTVLRLGPAEQDLAARALAEGVQDCVLKSDPAAVLTRAVQLAITRRQHQALQSEVLQRKQSEDILRDAVARYVRLLEAVKSYTYSVRIENGHPSGTEHGPGCMAVTGYSPGDYSADPILWITMVHPDDRELVRQHATQIIAGAPLRPLEHRIIHRDGRLRWVRNTVVRHYDSAGRLVRYDGFVEDVTERKEADQMMRENERLKAIGTLAGGVGHNFNIVMDVIAGSAAYLADSLAPDTRAHDEARRIHDAARHASDLTRRLIGVARICETGTQAPVEPVSVGQAIGEAVELIELAFAERAIRVVVGDTARMPWAQANASQLIDALMNLFLNAAEAMPGGGQIRVTVAARRIASRGAKRNRDFTPGEFVVVRVRDTGPGISREILPRIFEPFFTTRKSRGAFGLGLTVVRSIVQGWGGWISVRSREGAGASFRIFLPKAAAPEARGAAGAPAHTVLVVDDDAECLAFVRGVLEPRGYRLHLAERPETALALFAAHGAGIGLTIADAMMRAPDGKAVAEAILGQDPQAKLILTSGFSRDFIRARLPHGGWSYLQKPFDDDKLVNTVGEMLRWD